MPVSSSFEFSMLKTSGVCIMSSTLFRDHKEMRGSVILQISSCWKCKRSDFKDVFAEALSFTLAVSKWSKQPQLNQFLSNEEL